MQSERSIIDNCGVTVSAFRTGDTAKWFALGCDKPSGAQSKYDLVYGGLGKRFARVASRVHPFRTKGLELEDQRRHEEEIRHQRRDKRAR